MHFISGFSGSTMTEDGYIKPVLSWAVSDKIEEKEDDFYY